MGKRVVAAFDFDGTLIAGDSFIQFARHVHGTPRLLREIVRLAGPLLAWKLHLCKGGTVKEKLFSRLYKGMTIEEFRKQGASFAPALHRMENSGMTAELKRHLAEGASVFIVTASVPEWIEGWAAEYGLPPPG